MATLKTKTTRTLTQLRDEFRPYYFDREEARRVIRFFERELTHQLGELAGEPFRLERWQRRILRNFFGWKHRGTGLRKYRVLYLEVPRKNGKSILAAGLSLYCLDADREPAARVVCFALNEEQAREAVFDVAKEMVFSNPKLSRRIKPYKKSMAVQRTASNFRLLSGALKGKHGKNCSAIIGDEVHEWESREAMDALRTSMAARAQPIEVYLTTAGYDRNSVCWELHEHAENVNQGIVIDASFMGIIYAADPEADWRDPETWAQANPNLGVSVKMDYLIAECEKAKSIPAYENTFKRLHLNIWTEQDSRWLPIETWDACRAEFVQEDMRGRRCFIGVDLGGGEDVSAIVALFPPSDKFPKYRALSWFFLPEETIAKRAKRVNYGRWVDDGLIVKTPGAVTDYGFLQQLLNELRNVFEIVAISMDSWQAILLATQLIGDGFDVEFWTQGFPGMAAPTRELYRLILANQFEHDGNQVMRWMAKNAAVDQNSRGDLRPNKKKSKEKMDGIAALLNAIGKAIKEDGPSVYDSRGFLAV